MKFILFFVLTLVLYTYSQRYQDRDDNRGYRYRGQLRCYEGRCRRWCPRYCRYNCRRGFFCECGRCVRRYRYGRGYGRNGYVDSDRLITPYGANRVTRVI